MACIVVLYFCGLGLGFYTAAAAASSQLCALIPGDVSLHSEICVCIDIGIGSTSLSLFVVVAITTLPMLGFALAVLCPLLLILGTLLAANHTLGPTAGIACSAGVSLLVVPTAAWAILYNGSLCHCIGWSLEVQGHLDNAPGYTNDDVDKLVQALCDQCIDTGRELLAEGVIVDTDVQEMSAAVVLGLPAVALFKSLQHSLRTDHPEALLAGSCHFDKSFLQPRRLGLLVDPLLEARGILSSLTLSCEEERSITRWLLGQDHVATCQSRDRCDHISSLVSVINGVAIDVTRLDSFKRRSRQMFEELCRT